MVSTENCYKTNNFPVLYGAVSRNEYLYSVRIYRDKAPFQSVQSGIVRMRMYLGFMEARATVIDAYVKSDQNLQFLSLLCSSSARPSVFSAIMRKTAPQAIIEEVSPHVAEEYVSSRAVRENSASPIPLSSAVRKVHESKNILLSLLLEYRALIAEYASLYVNDLNGFSSGVKTREYVVSFLFFQKEGMTCAIPDFQVEKVSKGANESYILQIDHAFGKRVIVCDDLLFTKDIDLVRCTFRERASRGMYRISTPVVGGNFDFIIVVPSFL
ncbi:MAG TPA: hypothetical protein PKO22_11715 [Treponemataceae bacterium]|nr:hypothetical protein [Treponemataceae bacterium]